jgi:hypothetical protein
MTVAISGKNVALGAIIAAIGGLLTAIGVFLSWLDMSAGDMSEGGNGIELNAGKIVLVLGIAAAVAAVAWALDLKVPMLPLATVVIGAAILIALGLAYFTDILGDNGSMKDVIDMGSVLSAFGGGVSLGIGFILDIVGGIVVVVGGALGMAKK